MKTRANLLPWDCQRSHLVRQCLRRWRLPWIILAVSAILACGLLGAFYCWESRTAEQLREPYAPVLAMRERIGRLEAQLGLLRERAPLLDELEDPQPALTLIGTIGQSVGTCQGRLRVERLLLRGSPFVERGTGKADAGPPPAASEVTIKGTASDSDAVAQLVTALRRAGKFEHIRLRSSTEAPSAASPTCEYQIECTY